MAQRSSDGTVMTKEMWVPSGDQAMSDGLSSSRVICVVAPSASIQRTKICESLRKAMRVPSGDQRGLDPSSRKRAREPSAFITHTDEARRSSCWSTQDRV